MRKNSLPIKSNQNRCISSDILKISMRSFEKLVLQVNALTAIDDCSGKSHDWEHAKKIDDAQSGEDQGEAPTLRGQHLPRAQVLWLVPRRLFLRNGDQQGHRLVVIRLVGAHSESLQICPTYCIITLFLRKYYRLHYSGAKLSAALRAHGGRRKGALSCNVFFEAS